MKIGRVVAEKKKKRYVGSYLGEGGVSPFAPNQIPGLTAWYEARNTGFTYTDGQGVSQLNDLSGNGRHLTQATGASQPIFRTNSGQPYLEIIGAKSMNRLNVPILDLVGSNQFTCFTTNWATSAATAYFILSVLAPVTTNQLQLLLPNLANNLIDYGANPGGGRIAFAYPGGYTGRWKIDEILRSGNNLISVVDGSDYSPVTTFGDSLDAGTGTLNSMGCGSALNDARMSTLLIWNRTLSVLERGLVRNYLNSFKPV